ncbi:MAG: hypothetical protein K1X51_04785 [Rhodospirillaceae bacterium]|nr:hypothetical protein [Rhodospirillaceae bacterium]
MKILKGLAILSVMVSAGPAFAAEPRCNVMQFFDAKGALMPTTAPVIGMMVGDKPVYEPSMPGASSVRPGAETACPPNLVDGVRSTFENACMSDARRRQAAADHKVDSKVIDKGCSDMMKALGAAVATPK